MSIADLGELELGIDVVEHDSGLSMFGYAGEGACGIETRTARLADVTPGASPQGGSRAVRKKRSTRQATNGARRGAQSMVAGFF